METPRSLASSALTHPACRYTKAPNQITILRGNNEAWFLVNSIADKTRIHGVYVCIYVYVYICSVCSAERRHMAVCVAQNRLSRSRAPSFSLVFSQPPQPGKESYTLERARSPPACPFFHIAEYKLCYRPISRSRAVTYLRTLRLQG